jgi:subtilisin family serine protease
MSELRIGIVDTGVNPWHSHVRGRVSGCRLFVDHHGRIDEDGDFRDPSGHGTAVAGIIRHAFAHAEIFAVRVFDAGNTTFPSLVARGMLRAAAARCELINVSISVPPGPGEQTLASACAAIVEAGGIVVASARRDRPGWLPASLPGVHAVIADDALEYDEVLERGERELSACGRPRDLRYLAANENFAGDSFACAHALVHLARRRELLIPSA